jgi:hypothetical protein
MIRGIYLQASLLINISYVRFEVFTAVTMKKAIFWDIEVV